MRKAYQSDLSDEQWPFLEPLRPIPTATGRPKTHSTREILNAAAVFFFFYVVGGGCAWRLLAHHFPPWKTVYYHYYYFRSWRLETGRGRGCTPPSLRERVRGVRLKRGILSPALA